MGLGFLGIGTISEVFLRVGTVPESKRLQENRLENGRQGFSTVMEQLSRNAVRPRSFTGLDALKQASDVCACIFQVSRAFAARF